MQGLSIPILYLPLSQASGHNCGIVIASAIWGDPFEKSCIPFALTSQERCKGYDEPVPGKGKAAIRIVKFILLSFSLFPLPSPFGPTKGLWETVYWRNERNQKMRIGSGQRNRQSIGSTLFVVLLRHKSEDSVNSCAKEKHREWEIIKNCAINYAINKSQLRA